MTEHILISPLGFSPGAVSGVYFGLQKKGVEVSRVITVGTYHNNVRDAAGILEDLFRDEVAYEARYIASDDLRGAVGDASGPFAARMGLYIDRASRAGQTVHVAVTGGRSGMGALAALAAQIYGAHSIHHLWVKEEIERYGTDPTKVRANRNNRYVNPTVEGDQAWSLVELPFLPLSKFGQSPTNYPDYYPGGLTYHLADDLALLINLWQEQKGWVDIQTTVASGQYPQQPVDFSLSPSDAYRSYELGLRRLRVQLGRQHPQFHEFLIYEQRLSENIHKTRLFQDTETRRADRNEVIARLNHLALSNALSDFNTLARSNNVPELDETKLLKRILAILQTAAIVDGYDKDDLMNLADCSVKEPFARNTLEKIAEKDELGPLARWKEKQDVWLPLVETGATIATFVFTLVEFWAKLKGLL